MFGVPASRWRPTSPLHRLIPNVLRPMQNIAACDTKSKKNLRLIFSLLKQGALRLYLVILKGGIKMKHLDKVGVVGSIIAALCCLGVSAVLTVFSAIGLAFLIKDSILLPVLAFFLLITLFGLYKGFRSHRKNTALIVGILSSVVTFLFLFIYPSISYFGIAGLIAASMLNIFHKRTLEHKT